MEKIHHILHFWFQDLTDQDTVKKNKPPAKNWFIKSRRFDAMIQEQFEILVHDAYEGRLDTWTQSIEGTLALILLLDQFPRNIYRNTSKMYDADKKACLLTKHTIASGLDKNAMCIQRVFLYMPLMHAENVADQEECVVQFKRLINDAQTQCPHNTSYFEYNLKYAYDHLNVIKQFGRFPHRNHILGRVTTADEKEYLNNHGGF